MIDLTPLFSLNFAKRLLLVVIGVAIYVLPETLHAVTGAVFTRGKIVVISSFGFFLALTGFISIVFKYDIYDELPRSKKNEEEKNKYK